MDGDFLNELEDFVLGGRINTVQEKLNQQKIYVELRKKETQALKDLLGDTPEMMRKYKVLENLSSQIECMEKFQTYMQGIRDAMSFKELP